MDNKQSQMSLSKAIGFFGSQTKLAAALAALTQRPIKQGHISNWLNRDKAIPAEMCGPIEVATGGRVKRSDLRPDLFLPESGHDVSRS